MPVTIGGVEPESYLPGHGDLDLRKLRYFVAVADGLHFGKAAERLYIAQPVLSRQIRKLEQELGAELLVRSSRRVELTDAGRQLLGEARPLLAAAEAASRRVRRAADGIATLTVGFFIGDPISEARLAFGAARPDVSVDFMRIYWSDQTEVLLDARADVAFVHLPIDEEGLALARLYSAPRVALLAADHPLAGRKEISIAELADDPVIQHRGASPTWESFHNTDPRPGGRRPRPGPTVSNLEEKLHHVATGRAICFVPMSAVTAMQLPPDVTAVSVSDIAPTEVCLAWKAARESSLIAAFVDAARTVLVQAAHA